MKRVLLAAFAALALAGCGDGGQAVRASGEPPTKQEYAESVGTTCAPLTEPSGDLPAEVARLRAVRDRVRALPTPPEHGAEIRTRLLEPFDRYVDATSKAAGIVTGRTPSLPDLERSRALLAAADDELRTMHEFFADFGITGCGTG